MRWIHAVRAACVSALLLTGCGPGTTSAPVSLPNGGMPPQNPTPPGAPPEGTTQPGAPAFGLITDPREAALVKNELKQIGLAYNSYWDANPGKGPSKIEDLYPLLEGPQTPASKGLASGKYKVYLNATIPQMTNGTSNTVLGYYAGVPVAGGPVLMADGVVKNMTVDEFKAAAQAGKP